MTAASWAEAARELDRWMAARDYAGYDPHDFLASPVIRAATVGNRWAAVAWTQVGKRVPIQARRALGVPRLRNAKGVGLVLAASLRLRGAEAAGDGAQGGAHPAVRLVDWLAEHGDRRHGGVGWGYPFPWANRDFMVPAGTPSSVATAFVGHALLDAEEMLGLTRAGALARETSGFLIRGLNRIPGPDDTVCLSYTPADRRAVHNANLLAASLLARLHGGNGGGGRGGRGSEAAAELEGLARAATGFTLRAQRADGSWPYGVGRRNGWVDSFHTGYILLALAEIGRHVEVDGLEAALDRGLAYWRSAFLHGPAVSFHPGRPYPVDVHAVAQAILTLLGLRHRIGDARAEARRLAAWAMAEMRDPAGYFYYQHHGLWKNRTPYMRWIQAWMLRALAELAWLEAEDPVMAGGRPGSGSDAA